MSGQLFGIKVFVLVKEEGDCDLNGVEDVASASRNQQQLIDALLDQSSVCFLELKREDLMHRIVKSVQSYICVVGYLLDNVLAHRVRKCELLCRHLA